MIKTTKSKWTTKQRQRVVKCHFSEGSSTWCEAFSSAVRHRKHQLGVKHSHPPLCIGMFEKWLTKRRNRLCHIAKEKQITCNPQTCWKCNSINVHKLNACDVFVKLSYHLVLITSMFLLIFETPQAHGYSLSWVSTKSIAASCNNKRTSSNVKQQVETSTCHEYIIKSQTASCNWVMKHHTTSKVS